MEEENNWPKHLCIQCTQSTIFFEFIGTLVNKNGKSYWVCKSDTNFISTGLNLGLLRFKFRPIQG